MAIEQQNEALKKTLYLIGLKESVKWNRCPLIDLTDHYALLSVHPDDVLLVQTQDRKQEQFPLEVVRVGHSEGGLVVGVNTVTGPAILAPVPGSRSKARVYCPDPEGHAKLYSYQPKE